MVVLKWKTFLNNQALKITGSTIVARDMFKGWIILVCLVFACGLFPYGCLSISYNLWLGNLFKTFIYL